MVKHSSYSVLSNVPNDRLPDHTEKRYEMLTSVGDWAYLNPLQHILLWLDTIHLICKKKN